MLIMIHQDSRNFQGGVGFTHNEFSITLHYCHRPPPLQSSQFRLWWINMKKTDCEVHGLRVTSGNNEIKLLLCPHPTQRLSNLEKKKKVSDSTISAWYGCGRVNRKKKKSSLGHKERLREEEGGGLWSRLWQSYASHCTSALMVSADKGTSVPMNSLHYCRLRLFVLLPPPPVRFKSVKRFSSSLLIGW